MISTQPDTSFATKNGRFNLLTTAKEIWLFKGPTLRFQKTEHLRRFRGAASASASVEPSF